MTGKASEPFLDGPVDAGSSYIALNAAVEAARAGDLGRGFAVVKEVAAAASSRRHQDPVQTASVFKLA